MSSLMPDANTKSFLIRNEANRFFFIWSNTDGYSNLHYVKYCSNQGNSVTALVLFPCCIMVVKWYCLFS